MISACGETLSSKFNLAAKRQSALESMSMELWKRGPATDIAGQVLTMQDNLELVPRATVTLTDVSDPKKALRSDSVLIYESTTNSKVPTFYEWAGQRIPVRDYDFYIFNTYYHFMTAMAYAKKLDPDFRPDYLPNAKAADGTYRVYAVEPGDALNTGYNFLTKKTLFYKTQSGTAEGFNPGAEADTIYHEFAHSFMHSIKAPLVTAPTATDYYNPDLDAIQEGLADFFAAAVTRDDKVLQYLAANAKFYASTQDRMGSELFRQADNDLSFPDGYRNEIHMDGRLISATLNDVRRWLSGQKISQLKDCVAKPQACVPTPLSPAIPVEDAYDAVAQMAFTLFADLEEDSTFQNWAEILNGACTAGNSAFAICTSQPGMAKAITAILYNRGLLSLYSLIPAALQTGSGSGSDKLAGGVLVGGDAGFYPIYVDPTIGFIPFPNASLANTNATVEPCELILIFPNITNNTGSVKMTGQTKPKSAPLYDIHVELGGVVKFKTFTNPNSNVVVDNVPLGAPAANATDFPSRLFGWLDPGESSLTKLQSASSTWYKSLGHSVFTQQLSSTYFPTDVGFLVQAPESADATSPAKAYFRIKYRVYNSDEAITISNDKAADAGDTWLRVDTVPLQLTISNPTNKTFCN